MTLLELFPQRVPEPERMSVDEGQRFASWQSSPAGEAWYAALAWHLAERLVAAGLGSSPARLHGQVLCVAEGEGPLARALGRLCPGLEVLGVDLCPAMVERAQAHPATPDNVAYLVRDACELTDLGPIDAVFCVSSFHHFAHPARALRSMLAPLRSQGVLLLLDLRRDPRPSAYLSWLDRYLERDELIKARLFRDSVAAAYSAPELAGLFESCGPSRVAPLALSGAAREAYLQRCPSPNGALPLPLALASELFLEAEMRAA